MSERQKRKTVKTKIKVLEEGEKMEEEDKEDGVHEKRGNEE